MIKDPKNKKDVDWVAFDRNLMNCLKTKTNHRFSRYDAFLWLVDNIKAGHLVADKTGVKTREEGYIASYNHLADQWHWTRQSVAMFIHELSGINVISHEKDGNYFLFTLDSSALDTNIL